jgi:hypothetical protein
MSYKQIHAWYMNCIKYNCRLFFGIAKFNLEPLLRYCLIKNTFSPLFLFFEVHGLLALSLEQKQVNLSRGNI